MSVTPGHSLVRVRLQPHPVSQVLRAGRLRLCDVRGKRPMNA